MKSLIKLLSATILLLFTSHLHAQTWTPHNVGSVDAIVSISFPTADIGYVITEFPDMRKPVNGGISWTVVSTPAPVGVVYFITGLKGFAFGDSVVYMTQNGNLLLENFV